MVVAISLNEIHGEGDPLSIGHCWPWLLSGATLRGLDPLCRQVLRNLQAFSGGLRQAQLREKHNAYAELVQFGRRQIIVCCPGIKIEALDDKQQNRGKTAENRN
jgi:hypothetical protein